MSNDDFSFRPWLEGWGLTPDGAAIATHSSRLLPVRRPDGTLAMLKCPQEEFEKLGRLLMRWWDGVGAARVLEADETTGTLLLEKLSPTPSLLDMAHGKPEQDDAAIRILCAAAAPLHASRSTPLPADLVPLETWFGELWPMAAQHGGVLGMAADTARHLLNTAEPPGALHGDLHHSNVMMSARGWLAIDPKPLMGESGFDFGNILCNPDVALDSDPKRRMQRQFDVICAATGRAPHRLRQWIVAYAGLSAAWSVAEDDWETAKHPLLMAEIAAALSI